MGGCLGQAVKVASPPQLSAIRSPRSEQQSALLSSWHWPSHIIHRHIPFATASAPCRASCVVQAVPRPPFPDIYHVAFFTPGRFPSSAFMRNWYCGPRGQPFGCKRAGKQSSDASTAALAEQSTHPSAAKVAENAAPFAAHNAPVFDLGEARVAVHLHELELGLGAHALGEGRVADNVSERLSVATTWSNRPSALRRPWWAGTEGSHTAPARAARRPCAWCGRGCSAC